LGGTLPICIAVRGNPTPEAEAAFSPPPGGGPLGIDQGDSRARAVARTTNLEAGSATVRRPGANDVARREPDGLRLGKERSMFPDEIYAAPRTWAEKAYPNLIHYNRLPKGGHFAAWEQPEAFSNELRTAFRSLR
jgi:pimeloyl-ACP methyl ester carboxylesterase